MNRRVAVRGVILLDGMLLCVRQKKYTGRAVDDMNDYWCTPGGGVEPGEALLAALEREMVEELGVKPHIGNLLYVQQFNHKGNEHMELFFHITNAEDYQNVDLAKTTHGTREIARVEFIDPTTDTVLPTLLATEPLATDAAAGHTNFFDYLGN